MMIHLPMVIQDKYEGIYELLPRMFSGSKTSKVDGERQADSEQTVNRQ